MTKASMTMKDKAVAMARKVGLRMEARVIVVK